MKLNSMYHAHGARAYWISGCGGQAYPLPGGLAGQEVVAAVAADVAASDGGSCALPAAAPAGAAESTRVAPSAAPLEAPTQTIPAFYAPAPAPAAGIVPAGQAVNMSVSIPTWVLVGGVALGAWYLYSRRHRR